MAASNGAIALHLVTTLLAVLNKRDPGLLAEVEAAIRETASSFDDSASIHGAVAIVTSLARADRP